MLTKTSFRTVSVFLIVGCILSFGIDGQQVAEASSTDPPASDSRPTDEEDFFDLPLGELAEVKIVTASKVPEYLSETTSTVTVITANDLRRMGARSIHDALIHVPGLGAGLVGLGEAYFSVRGIYSHDSEKVLFLLNGHVLNAARTGSASSQYLERLPIENIDRIEVVRGPGSALYGANAFLAVINVIAKGPDDVDGIEVHVDSEFEDNGTVGQSYDVLLGHRFDNGAGVVLNFSFVNQLGPELRVASDVFGRKGVAETDQEEVDFQGRLEYGPLSIQGRLFQREAGGYYGIMHATGGDAELYTENGFIEASLDLEPGRDIQMTLLAYVDHTSMDNHFEALPAGSIPPGSPFFPWNDTGLIGNPQIDETNYGGEVQFVYEGIEGHTPIAGLAGRRERQHDATMLSNANPSPLPSVRDVSGEYNWIENADRDIWSVYVQDIWDIHERLRLTAGSRFDHYSDFGDTTNPRVGLAWDVLDNVDLKLSYGTAFRAPDFGSQFVANNPAILGNPDLDPEEIETFEGSIGVRLFDRLYTRVTLYRSDLDDLIQLAPGAMMVDNVGDMTAEGVEIEARYEFGSGACVAANYTLSDAELEGDVAPNVPRHSGSVMANVPLCKYVDWNVNTYWQTDTNREEIDSRSDMDGYAIVNTTVLARGLCDGLELQFSVFNLFDDGYAYPAPPATLAKDYRAPRRSFVVGAEYRF